MALLYILCLLYIILSSSIVDTDLYRSVTIERRILMVFLTGTLRPQSSQHQGVQALMGSKPIWMLLGYTPKIRKAWKKQITSTDRSGQKWRTTKRPAKNESPSFLHLRQSRGHTDNCKTSINPRTVSLPKDEIKFQPFPLKKLVKQTCCAYSEMTTKTKNTKNGDLRDVLQEPL